MEKHIELYLKPTKYEELQWAKCKKSARILSTTESLSPAETRVKKYIKNLADKKKIKVTTYDLTNTKVSLKALFKGIRKPTIVLYGFNNVSKVPIVDDLSEKHLESLIM